MDECGIQNRILRLNGAIRTYRVTALKVCTYGARYKRIHLLHKFDRSISIRRPKHLPTARILLDIRMYGNLLWHATAENGIV